MDANKVLPWLQLAVLIGGGFYALGEMKSDGQYSRDYYDEKFQAMDERFQEVERKQDQKLQEFADLRLTLGEKIIVLEVTQEGIVTRIVDVEKQIQKLTN